MKKIIINKEDIAGIEVTVDSWIFTLNEDQAEMTKKVILKQNQQEIEDMHAKSGKFGGSETL